MRFSHRSGFLLSKLCGGHAVVSASGRALAANLGTTAYVTSLVSSKAIISLAFSLASRQVSISSIFSRGRKVSIRMHRARPASSMLLASTDSQRGWSYWGPATRHALSAVLPIFFLWS